MVQLCVSLFAVGLVRVSQAEIITVPFSAVVDEFLGAPFGIQAEAGVTPVTGWFRYDTSTPPVGPPCTNCESFLAKPPSAFLVSIGGVTIISSDFVLSNSNNVTNFGGSDLFLAGADSDGLNSMGGEFLVNGTQTDGAASIWLVDTDRLMFLSDAQSHFLPTPTQLLHVDFVTGHLADEHAPGGENVNVIGFRGSVPEPCAILLAAQSLCVLARRRPRKGVVYLAKAA